MAAKNRSALLAVAEPQQISAVSVHLSANPAVVWMHLKGLQFPFFYFQDVRYPQIAPLFSPQFVRLSHFFFFFLAEMSTFLSSQTARSPEKCAVKLLC